MKNSLRLLLAAAAISVLAACGNNSTSNTASADAAKAAPFTGSPLGNVPDALTMSVDAYKPTVNEQAASPMKARNLNLAPSATSIALGAPLESMSAAANATTATLGKPLQIGFARAVSQTTSEAATQQALKWKTTPSGGNVAAISFSSTGAKGLRLGLLVTKLPQAATLRYYTNGAATAFEVTGKDVLSILARNLASGDKSDAGRTYWGPVFDNAEITLEIELPAGISTDSLEVSIPSVIHAFRSISEAVAMNHNGSSQSCNVDVNCVSPRPAVSNAVAWLSFATTTGSYICSGTMLNNSTNDGTPYLLTANHCINSQTVASTLATEWFSRTSSCNSPNASSTGFPMGATLLYTAYKTDSTLVRFNNAALYGVLFAGWDATTPASVGLPVADIHHPSGDFQRISRGSVQDYYTRDAQGNFFYSNVTNSTFYGVTLTSGLAEGGSSGSGLFKNISSTNAQLIGQLWGGAAGTCSTATSSNPQELAFGRFDKAFNAGMKIFLRPDAAAPNPNRQPVYRFYIPQSGVYFYTIYASERDDILATKSNAFTYEGIAFYASPTPTAGFSGIYRFRNKTTGAYLYTISEVEKADILQNYPQFLLEGTAWYAEQGPAGGGSPLFRFRTTSGTHIYTAYDSEKASILANYPGFVLEGPAYYVKLAP
jgi:V8-like Glu-specific endopeptidase